jgi:hypothetical protein
MHPVTRYQSQLLMRRNYKPQRVSSARSSNVLKLVFRPSRGFGFKPRLEIVQFLSEPVANQHPVSADGELEESGEINIISFPSPP